MTRKPGTVLRAARTYIGRGWAVFPLQPYGKLPLKGSHGVLEASTKLDDIQRWFADREDLNIGIAAGASGLVIFDVDTRDGGDESLARWIRDNGPFPRTVESLTGNGGRHLLFRCPDGLSVPLRAPWRPDYPGVDIRASNGYIMAPPSIHPNGRAYEFDLDNHPADIEVAELSGSALEFVLSALDGAPALHSAPDTGDYEAPEPFPDVIHDGEGRERALVALAGSLRRSGLGEEEILPALSAFNDTRIVPPKSDKDLRRIAGSVSRYKPDPTAAMHLRHELKHGTPEEIPETPETAPDDEAEGFASLVESFPVWAARADEEVPELIPGVLHAGSLAMMASGPKTGKTWLAYDLILSVVSGVRFMGHYEVSQTGKVLYVGTEGIHADSRDRLRSMAFGKGIDPDTLTDFDIIWRHSVRLDDPDFMEFLAGEVEKYALIVVDVLADAWSGDENKSDSVRKMLAGVRALTDTGCTVLLLHHTTKPSAEQTGRRSGYNMRGSGAFYGAIDDGIYLTPTGERCRSVVELETRAGAPAKPEKWEFAWPTETVDGIAPCVLEWSEHSAEVNEAADGLRAVQEAVMQEVGISRKTIVERTGLRAETVSRCLTALVSMNRIQAEDEQQVDKIGRGHSVRMYYPKRDLDDF